MLEERRSIYRRQAFRAAIRAGRADREADELDSAETAFRKALRIDSLQEESASGLIRVLAEAGRRSEALKVYRRFQERRREQLDLAPSGELRDLVERLRDSGGDDGTTVTDSVEPASGDTAGRAPSDATGPSPLGLSLPSTRAGLLAGLLVIAASALAGRVSSSPDDGVPAGGTASVAVLPFHTSGSADRIWQDGMVTARVLRTDSGERLGSVEVRGHPDSAAALTDDLTRRLIGLSEDRTDETLRRADVASLTAGSVDALKSYLEGEQHLRAGRAESAMEDFQAAIRADSGFALPYARIGLYGLWRHEGTGWATRRAHELSDQLPERDRRLVRALHMGRIQHRTLAAADSFRQLGREYPDDPSVWSSLGEFVFHAGIPGGLPEIEKVHARAVALNPDHTAYYDHYVGPAFTLHHDSALAARRVEAMPEGEWKRMYRIGLDLAFGRDEARRRALRWMDSALIHEYWLAFGPLESP